MGGCQKVVKLGLSTLKKENFKAFKVFFILSFLIKNIF